MPIFLAKALEYLASVNWGGALAWAARYWRELVILLLVITSSLSIHTVGVRTEELKTERASHAADIKSYKDAQAAAEKLAADTKARLQKENEAKANEADKSYGSLLTLYRANLLRYKAAQSVAHQSGFGKQGGGTQGTDGPSYSTNVPAGELTISNEDANICAVNTARLQAAHDWAESLQNDEGK